MKRPSETPPRLPPRYVLRDWDDVAEWGGYYWRPGATRGETEMVHSRGGLPEDKRAFLARRLGKELPQALEREVRESLHEHPMADSASTRMVVHTRKSPRESDIRFTANKIFDEPVERLYDYARHIDELGKCAGQFAIEFESDA